MTRNDDESTPRTDASASSGVTTVRRRLLKGIGGLGVGGVATAVGSFATGTSAAQSSVSDHSSPDLTKWVDDLPRPDVVDPVGTRNGQPYYEIEMQEVEQTLHSDLPATTVWGYDGQFPGPTIEATQGEPIYVRWQNDLPDEHLLPVDTSVHEDVIPYDEPGVRTVTHLHGGNVEADSDGKPRAWFTRDFERTGPDFTKKEYYYVNDQPPATLWYHDHTLGITRLNVYAGLAGLYLLRNDHERSLNLPAGEYEIPLVLQDRSFNEDGSLFYPTAVADASGDEEYPDPSIVPQFFGDTSVVNGTAWPRLSVEPRKYRFRLLNGSQSRFYDLKLIEYDEESGTTGDGGPPLTLIGNDGGLLAAPRQVDGRLELGTAKRADVVVDFADHAGETLLLHNAAPAPFRGPTSDQANERPLPEVLLIDVESGDVDDPSQVPGALTTMPDIPTDAVDRERYLPLVSTTDEYGRRLHLLGSAADTTGHRLLDPVTEDPGLGDTEIWSFANLTGMSHPIHLHLVHFQVLGREDYSEYDREAGAALGSLEPPEASELGWNDVVTVNPLEVVHVIAHFGEFQGLFTDQTGRYMWHCHMLEHEDHDMMRPYTVTDESDGGDDGDGDGDDGDDGDGGGMCTFPVDDSNRDGGGPIYE